MFPYEHVKSIHDQKMAQFGAERDRAQMAQMRRHGQPGAMETVAQAIGQGLLAIGEAVRPRGGRRLKSA